MGEMLIVAQAHHLLPVSGGVKTIEGGVVAH